MAAGRVTMVPKGWPNDDTKSFQWGRVGISGLVVLAFLGDGMSGGARVPRQPVNILNPSIRHSLSRSQSGPRDRAHRSERR